MQKSVQFVTDAEGRKTAVILPIEEYEEMMEDLEMGRAARESEGQPRRPSEDVVKECRTAHLARPAPRQMRGMTGRGTAVRIRQELVIEIPGQTVAQAFLSVPRWDSLNARGGIVRDRRRSAKVAAGKPLPAFDVSSDAKLPYDLHLAELGLSPRDPLIVVGARNLGNNLRIVAYKKEKGLLQLFGEDADKGERDYFCLCYMHGGAVEPHTLRFAGGRISDVDGKTVSPDTEATVRWALSGQPLLWNGKTDEHAIILNTYDLRHFWHIPTGEGRFGERGHAGELVEELATILVATGDANALKERAAELGMQREQDYLHSAIGVSEEGNLVLAQLHGSFELVADRLRKAGATHAIELEEGGSVSTHFVYQKGTQRTIRDSLLQSTGVRSDSLQAGLRGNQEALCSH